MPDVRSARHKFRSTSDGRSIKVSRNDGSLHFTWSWEEAVRRSLQATRERLWTSVAVNLLGLAAPFSSDAGYDKCMPRARLTPLRTLGVPGSVSFGPAEDLRGTIAMRGVALTALLVTAAADPTDWAAEVPVAEDIPEPLLLLQVQYRLTNSKDGDNDNPHPMQKEAADQEEAAEEEAVSFLQGEQEISKVENNVLAQARATSPQTSEQTLQHLSIAAALLLSRSTARIASLAGQSPDLFGEIVLTTIALVVWIFLMMFCSWLGFGGTNRLEEQKEMERQEKHLPPEKHDPIDAAAAQMKEAQERQAKGRKEKRLRLGECWDLKAECMHVGESQALPEGASSADIKAAQADACKCHKEALLEPLATRRDKAATIAERFGLGTAVGSAGSSSSQSQHGQDNGAGKQLLSLLQGGCARLLAYSG
eukprot:s133_g24.t3